MPYISIKRIGKNKRPYAYLQESRRVGKKVKTRSKYLGPAETVNAGGHLLVKLLADPQFRAEFSKLFEERMAEKDSRDAFRAAAENAPVMIGDLKAGEFTQEMFDQEGMSRHTPTLTPPKVKAFDEEEYYDIKHYDHYVEYIDNGDEYRRTLERNAEIMRRHEEKMSGDRASKDITWDKWAEENASVNDRSVDTIVASYEEAQPSGQETASAPAGDSPSPQDSQ